MTGTAVIPHDFTGESTDSIGNFMANWFALRDYINQRELTVGLLANRPVAGHNGASYLATDVQGGTLYLDNGAVWVAAAAGASATINQFIPALPYVPVNF